MADINKITKTKLKATEKNTSPTVNLEPGEIKVITKSRLIGNISGGESADTEINLYNHFIKITGNASKVESGRNIVARLTIQSSNNLVVDTPEKLSTLLGEEFELGCNGIYSNYNIIGLKKTVDGDLNIIYNTDGAEELLSTTGITLTITDTIKTI